MKADYFLVRLNRREHQKKCRCVFQHFQGIEVSLSIIMLLWFQSYGANSFYVIVFLTIRDFDHVFQ